MFHSDVRRAAIPAWAILGLLALYPAPAHAAEYTVKQDGSGAFTTIQACANAALPGDTCLVSAGLYAERIITARSGAPDARIAFRASGLVQTKGFDINHAYVTVEGFRVTGAPGPGMIVIGVAGNACQITNNTIADGAAGVYGLFFAYSGGTGASDCVVRGNMLTNLLGMYIKTAGSGHLFEGNTLQYTNRMDYVYFFGSNLTFRRNLFIHGTTAPSGNHQDLVQVFGDGEGAGHQQGPAQDVLFEENWFTDFEGAFCQVTSSDIDSGTLYTDIKNLTFRRNVFVNIAGNGSIVMPGVRFEHNTFYRLAYSAYGLSYSGSLTRGDGSRGAFRNNVSLASGAQPTNPEYVPYALMGARMNREVVGVHITNDQTAVGDQPGNATTQGLHADLVANGYLLSTDGYVTSKARSLTDISSFVQSGTYAAYRQATYDHLRETVALDTQIRTTFDVDYNYVAGPPPTYAAKKTTGCTPGASFAQWNFCEPHGINGGDPQFADLSNPLGPDGIPFTLDDGLKPLPTSPLCGRGAGGSDIGAYSCDPLKVFPDAPRAPANVVVR